MLRVFGDGFLNYIVDVLGKLMRHYLASLEDPCGRSHLLLTVEEDRGHKSF
jgi:hypothetical protein